MCVPTADIDEANSVFIAHQPTHTYRLQLKSFRGDGAAIGFVHFLLHRLRDLLPQLEAIGDDRIEMMVFVHLAQERRLALVEYHLADAFQRNIRDVRWAFKYDWERIGERY